ncbi:uncharacterized protein RCC_05876 [Ramularia collo-cygni]|uniref:Release factor glutamine methyltransferase N-terminal domain-containing protein n=1 Tax=Ramularia collo-cygni TaxID=112498 RepID=A0A2D3VE65_9PEZI|nr:uncharacterized protein RCC_05876 [Ramularia collo-cygni]CZT20019.1 uncharacterized protein RCC_05876 [Ramularia collo-cygni]
MPRINPKDILRARSSANKALLSLLPVCRDLRSARNEVKWMTEHALDIARRLDGAEPVQHAHILSNYVQRRAGGEPLQYILGSEYFGELEIKCRPGVLIPRQETAASVTHLARLLHKSASPLKVLDLCTGTGCIPLLFHNVFYSSRAAKGSSPPALDILGVDISSVALSLARENLVHQIASQAQKQATSQEQTRSLHRIGFVQADVSQTEKSLLPALARVSHLDEEDLPPSFDILISNPPYISPSARLPRSVRLYEPELALIPSSPSSSKLVRGDEFYPALLNAADLVNAKILLFEVGDLEQAKRVAGMAIRKGAWDTVEIWRDDPSHDAEEVLEIAGERVQVRGEGNGRSVVAFRGDGNGWIDSY